MEPLLCDTWSVWWNLVRLSDAAGAGAKVGGGGRVPGTQLEKRLLSKQVRALEKQPSTCSSVQFLCPQWMQRAPCSHRPVGGALASGTQLDGDRSCHLYLRPVPQVPLPEWPPMTGSCHLERAAPSITNHTSEGSVGDRGHITRLFYLGSSPHSPIF